MLNEYYYVELWTGTGCFTQVARSRNIKVWNTDKFEEFGCSYTGDILDTETQHKIVEMVDNKYCLGVWMSPVCTKWSMSAGNTYWDEFRMPKREDTYEGIKMMMFARLIADICVKRNKPFFIENPKARASWILDNQYRKEVWYCQYGDTRAKPTYIWTNLNIEFRTCKRFVKGQPKHCHHESAPRGSKTGTQALKGNKERSVIPLQLFEEILDHIEQEKVNVK